MISYFKKKYIGNIKDQNDVKIGLLLKSYIILGY